jgi:hypothetical protein
METWYSRNLGDGFEAYQPTKQIINSFTQLHDAAGNPIHMVVFSREDRKTNIITAYFSPSAHALAALFNATPCEKPSPAGLTFLVGDRRAWDIFYPGIEYGDGII